MPSIRRWRGRARSATAGTGARAAPVPHPGRPRRGRRSWRAVAGRGTAGGGPMRPGWPHGHGGYLPRGGIGDSGRAGSRARVPAARHGPQSRASRLPPGRTGAEQVSAACPPGAPGTWPHRKGGAWPGGGPGPVRDEALTQVAARRAGPVTRLPFARPRSAAPCQPTAVVRSADMTSVALPTGPPAFQQCLGEPALSAGRVCTAP